MAITFVSGVYTPFTSSTSCVAAVPSGVANGNLILAWALWTVSVTPPAGWTLINSVIGGKNLDLYGRIASSEPATYTWTTGANGYPQVLMRAYGGVTANTVAAAINGSAVAAQSGATVAIPQITESFSSGEWYVAGYLADQATFATPTPLTLGHTVNSSSTNSNCNSGDASGFGSTPGIETSTITGTNAAGIAATISSSAFGALGRSVARAIALPKGNMLFSGRSEGQADSTGTFFNAIKSNFNLLSGNAVNVFEQSAGFAALAVSSVRAMGRVIVAGTTKPTGTARASARAILGAVGSKALTAISHAVANAKAIVGGSIQPPACQLAFISSSTASSNTTSVVVPVPAGVIGAFDDNDDSTLIMFVIASSSLGTVDVTTPAGWSLISKVLNYNSGGSNRTLAVYYRIASSEPASYTVTGTSSTAVAGFSAAMLAYDETLQVSPIDTSANAGTSGAGSTTLTVPAFGSDQLGLANGTDTLALVNGTDELGVLSFALGEWAVYCFTTAQNTQSIISVTPATMTQRVDYAPGDSFTCAIAVLDFIPNAPIAAQTGTWATSTNLGGIGLLLKPCTSAASIITGAARVVARAAAAFSVNVSISVASAARSVAFIRAAISGVTKLSSVGRSMGQARGVSLPALRLSAATHSIARMTASFSGRFSALAVARSVARAIYALKGISLFSATGRSVPAGKASSKLVAVVNGTARAVARGIAALAAGNIAVSALARSVSRAAYAFTGGLTLVGTGRSSARAVVAFKGFAAVSGTARAVARMATSVFVNGPVAVLAISHAVARAASGLAGRVALTGQGRAHGSAFGVVSPSFFASSLARSVSAARAISSLTALFTAHGTSIARTVVAFSGISKIAALGRSSVNILAALIGRANIFAVARAKASSTAATFLGVGLTGISYAVALMRAQVPTAGLLISGKSQAVSRAVANTASSVLLRATARGASAGRIIISNLQVSLAATSRVIAIVRANVAYIVINPIISARSMAVSSAMGISSLFTAIAGRSSATAESRVISITHVPSPVRIVRLPGILVQIVTLHRR